MSWGKVKIDQADKLCSQYVRLRDGCCLRCFSQVKKNQRGLPISHQCSHFQGRGKENTRFNLDNLATLCGGCHQYFTANPAEHYQWQVERLGQAKVDEVVLLSNMYCKRNREAERLYWEQKLQQDFNV